MTRVSPSGRAIPLILVVCALAACTGEPDSTNASSLLEPVTPTSVAPPAEPPPSSSTSAATTVPAATDTSLDLVGEDLVFLHGGALAAAWNRGDLDEFWSYFTADATFGGLPLGSPGLAADVAYWQAIGWRVTWQNCEWPNARYAECKTRYTDDFHGPAGLEYLGGDQFWFDDAGLITVLGGDVFGSPRIDQFDDEFEAWLSETYPETAAGYLDADSEEGDHGAIREAAAAVPEFLVASASFPIEETQPIPDPKQTGTVEGIAIYNTNADQQDLVRWAIDRFDTAGLALPLITHITFPPTEACASGVRGMAFSDGNQGHLDICAEPDEFTGDADFSLPLQTSTLHEFAHLWTAQYIDPTTQQAFMDLRGLQQWSGDVPWEFRGTEQAAEVVTWALLDESVIWRLRDIPLFPRIRDATCARLTAAYETLTGIPPSQRNTDCTDPQ